jgi:hypothetical protein
VVIFFLVVHEVIGGKLKVFFFFFFFFFWPNVRCNSKFHMKRRRFVYVSIYMRLFPTASKAVSNL